MATPAASSMTPQARAVDHHTTVGEIMRPGIVTCARSATAEELARIMHTGRTDCVVILSSGKNVEHFPVVWGLVTREDLLRPLAELDPVATAEQIARTPIVRVHADLSIAEAQSLCAAVGVSHLLVIDPAHGTPLGVISEADLTSHPVTHTAQKEDSPCTTTC